MKQRDNNRQKSIGAGGHRKEGRSGEAVRVEALLEAVVQGTGDMVAAEDREFRYLYFNEAYREEFKRLWGTEIEVGTSMPEAMAAWPAEQEKAMELWGRAMGGETFGIEKEFGPSKLQVYDLRFSPIHDGDGRVIGAVHVIRNVTAQRRSEGALLNSQRLLAEAEALSGTGAWEWDTANDRWTLSETWLAIHGCGERTLSREELMQIAHPEDRGVIGELMDALQDGAGQYDIEHRIVRQDDGEVRTVRSRGRSVRDEHGSLVRVYGFVQDITDLRRAEEELRASEYFHRQALESIPGMVFTTRPDGYCDYQSRQWAEYTGVPMEEHLGDGWNKLLHPDDKARAYEAWRAAVRGRAPYDLEYRVRRHNGRYEWFRVAGRPIRDEAGQIVRWFGVAVNIEALKEAEVSLRKSEAMLQTALDHLGEGVVIATAGKDVIRWNPAALAMCGFDHAEEALRPLADFAGRFELWTPDGRRMLSLEEWPMSRIAGGETLDNVELRIRRPDQGWERIVSYSGTMLESMGGERLIYLSMYDMTEQRKAEAAMRRSSQFPEENPSPVLRVDASGALVYANRVAHEWLRTLGWDGGALPEAVLAAVEQARAQEHAVSAEITNSSGRTVMIWSVKPPGEDYVNLYGSDVSELKRAEEAVREGQENLERTQALSLVMPLHVSLDGRWLKLPPRFVAFLGYDSEEELLGRPFKDVTHPDDFQADWRQCLRLLNREIKSFEMEKRFIRKDGSITWGYINCSTVEDREARPLHFLTYVRDINAEKAAEEELWRLNESLEERVRERTAELERRAEQLSHLASELTLAEQRERHRLAKVLHDHLQQLLVAAKLGVEGLAYNVEDEAKEMFNNVQELINESIAASRSLTVELSPTILHEAGLAAGLEWLARWMEKKHGLEVELDMHKEAVTDREDIRILLFESVRELLFNVVKHADTTRARVSLVRRDAEIEITVSDEGAGFDVSRLGSREGRTAGGFGLFSIRERIELLGGRLEIESRPGGGSRFILTAPAVYPGREVEFRMEQKRKAAEQEEAVIEGKLAALRVLIVDDHKVLRQSMAARLRREADMEIAGEAGDGQEAVDLVRQLRPDVVLMDYSMPRMDGVEATQRICEECPEVRVIGLSMYEEADRANAMLDAGACGYVTKSAEFDELLAAIRSAGYAF